MLWFKILSKTGRACHGGDFRYDLPKGDKPGKWTPQILQPQLCLCGYHVVSAQFIDDWEGFAARRRLFVAQIRTSADCAHTKFTEEKLVCMQIRLLREIKKGPNARRAYNKAMKEAHARWDCDKYCESELREQQWQGLVTGYVERKMDWRKPAK